MVGLLSLIFRIFLAFWLFTNVNSLGSFNYTAIFSISDNDYDPDQTAFGMRQNLTSQEETSSNTGVSFTFLASTPTVDFENSFALSKLLCKHLKEKELAALLSTAASQEANSMIASYANAFKVPYVSISPYEIDVDHDYYVNLRPNLIKPILALRRKLGWERLTYIVDSQEGMNRVRDILDNLEDSSIDFLVRSLNTSVNVESVLAEIRDESETKIMIDCSMNITIEILEAMYRMQMLLKQYHIVIVNVAAPSNIDPKYGKGGVNITGFSMSRDVFTSLVEFQLHWKTTIETQPKITPFYEFSSMLAYDGYDLLYKAFKQSQKVADNLYRLSLERNLSCETAGKVNNEIRQKADMIVKVIKNMRMNGITGNIQFDKNGRRTNYSLNLEILPEKRGTDPVYVGTWDHDLEDFVLDGNFRFNQRNPNEMKRHLIITSLIEPPFLMNVTAQDGTIPTGNERFEGYCKDLADKLSKDLGFTYEIVLVEDGEYGGKVNGSWNGLIGEVISGKADLALAGLTINAERQRVVSFTKPFMNIGISIMILRPKKKLPGPLSFLDPFSNHIWIGIIIAYVSVSIGLFIVARFSPTEWRIKDTGQPPSTSGTHQMCHNDFSLYNSMWFSLGALMQQGTDIAPRATGSRIVGGVWWFFTLIIISSYTANLAAFLTVETMDTPIKNADDLQSQTDIAYGTRRTGSTRTFFENSEIDVYKKMWMYMKDKEDVFVSTNDEGIKKVRNSNGKYAYLIESAANEYVQSQKPCNTLMVGPNLDSKGYGIAANLNSTWIKNITLKILKYQEDGELERLKTTWWVDKGECGGAFSSTKTDSTNSLGLSSVAGIFYILISGLALAIISAILEYLLKSWQHSIKTKSGVRNSLRYNAELSVIGREQQAPPSYTSYVNSSQSTDSMFSHPIQGFSSPAASLHKRTNIYEHNSPNTIHSTVYDSLPSPYATKLVHNNSKSSHTDV